MHYYFYLSKVQIRKNVLKYSNEVKIQQWKHVASGVSEHTGTKVPSSTRGHSISHPLPLSLYCLVQIKANQPERLQHLLALTT